MKEKIMKNSKGITLIALVITIIILIILAGVSINIVLEDNGLITKVSQASKEYEKEEAKEKLIIVLKSLSIEKKGNYKLEDLIEINRDEIKVELTSDNKVKTNSDDTGNYAIVEVNKHIFKVYENFNIDIIENSTSNIDKEDYIQDGLIILYDGINNTRNGHDVESQTWENLVENSSENTYGILKNVDFSNNSGWTNNSLILDGINDWVQMNYINYENITIEIVAKPLNLKDGYEQPYITNNQNGGLGISKSQNDKNSGYKYIDEVYKYTCSSENTRINKIYSLSYGHDKQTGGFFRENSEFIENQIIGEIGEPEYNTVFALGTNPEGTGESLNSTNARFNLEIYSVRIYDRCLTEEETKHNYEIDKERFNINEINKQQFEYINEDLIYLYDGEINTLAGNSKRTSNWSNLAGYKDATLKNITYEEGSGWTNNSLILDGINDWVQLDYIDYDNITIEIVAKPINIKDGCEQNYIANFEDGGIGIVKSKENKNAICINVSGSYKYIYSENNTQINKIYSLSLGHDKDNGGYFRENDIYNLTNIVGSIKNPTSNTQLAIGTNPNGTGEYLTSTNARFNLEVYSVRIYNRCLTEEETKHNYEIDKERFGI